MKKAIWILLIIVLAFPIGMVSAQEPGTKEDNACYEGGSMAGKCDTPWEWVCGYYLARWEANGGWATPNNPFNDACASLLPPLPSAEAASILRICHNVVGGRLCANSDNIGTWDMNPPDGVLEGLYLYTNDAIPAGCPATLGGKILLSYGASNFLLGYSFTSAEIAALGLGINVCFYG